MAHFRNKKKGFVKHAVKKKQQPSVDHITGDKIPKSFVFSRAKLPGLKDIRGGSRKFVQNHQVPDLRSLQDVSDFVTRQTYASVLLLLGWFSEDGDEAATVILTSDLGRVNRASTKSAVKLQETGPKNDFTTCQG
ncbi:hypothetical protein ACOSQ2_000451 [Xanthoceras sorbifolium]